MDLRRENFYWLHDPLLDAPFRGTVGREAFEVMMSAWRGEVVPAAPIVVSHSMGGRLRDFIWIGTIPIVHERVVEALMSANLTGWDTYPVQVFTRDGKAAADYHGFAITGRCGSLFLDKEHSEVVYQDYPGGRFPKYKGLFVTTDSWDGSDLFIAADGKTGWKVVTQRVVEIFRRKKVTNVSFEPVSEVLVDAPDQPAFPRKQDSLPMQSAPVFEERSIDHEVQEELRLVTGAGAVLIEAFPEQEPLSVIKRIEAYVAAARPLEGEELLDRALELGCLWGQQVVIAAGWIWVELHSADKTVHYAIVSSDRSFAILPGVRLRLLLADGELPDNSVLLFNMVCAGKLPKAEPGAFVVLS